MGHVLRTLVLLRWTWSRLRANLGQERLPQTRLMFAGTAARCVEFNPMLSNSIYHVVKVPWAAALAPDAGRDAAHAAVTRALMPEYARLAAERLPTSRRVRDELKRTRGRARERARAPDEWT